MQFNKWKIIFIKKLLKLILIYIKFMLNKYIKYKYISLLKII